MTELHQELPTRSRRALLTAAAGAAAGAAAAVAASAVAPAAVLAADPDDVVKDQDNATTDVTSITQGSADVNAFEGHGSGSGVGVLGSTEATVNAGIVGLAGDSSGSTYVTQGFDLDAGVYGHSGSDTGVGSGVYGEGTVGVWGYGDYGVEAQGFTTGLFASAFPIGTAIHGHAGDGDAPAPMTGIAIRASVTESTEIGLRAAGRIQFPNRSGKVTFSAGSSSKSVTIAGMTSSHYAFAVLNSTRSGVYVRAVVPGTNKITIYLNKAPSSSTAVAWLVLG
jgi:hypothetical protein